MKKKMFVAPIEEKLEEDINDHHMITKRHREQQQQATIARSGWLWVSVGAEKRRIMMRTEYVNHPIFRELLDHESRIECESSTGPIALPSCSVSRFYNALIEMDRSEANPGRRGVMISPFSVFAGHQF